MIPGVNLLSIALTVISPQTVMYFRDARQRVELDNGILITQFEKGRIVGGCSVQAIPQEKVNQMGLDVSFNYVEWLVPQKVIGLERDASGDEIKWGGKRWKVTEKIEDWTEQDGWCSVTCQEIKKEVNNNA